MHIYEKVVACEGMGMNNALLEYVRSDDGEEPSIELLCGLVYRLRTLSVMDDEGPP